MKKALALLLVFVMFWGALSCASAAEESLKFDAALMKLEYGSTCDWETVAKSDDSLALFTALCLRDMENGLGSTVFSVGKVSSVYACNLAGSVMLYVHTPTMDWNVYCLSLDIPSAYPDDSPMADSRIIAFLDYAVSQGLYEAYLPVNLTLMNNYLSYEPETADSVEASGGTESLFRKAESVSAFSCGWAMFRFQNKAGYINPAGEFMMNDWNYAQAFESESRTAIVYRGKTSSWGYASSNDDGTYDGVWGLIDDQGNEVLPLEYDLIDSPYAEGIIRTRTKDGVYQLFDLNARGFITIKDPSIVYMSHLCSNGLIAVFSGTLNEKGRTGEGAVGSWGFIDKEGNTVIPCAFESVGYTWHNGMTYAKKNGKTGVIDSQGNTVIPFTWDSISLEEDQIIAKKDEKSYLLDLSGTILLAFDTKYAYAESNNLFTVYEDFSNDGGLLDISGNVVLPREYYDIQVIDDHLARVGRKQGDDKIYGIIDYTTGKMVVPMVYNYISVSSDNEVELLAFEQLGYYGYMDREFKPVIAPQYLDYNNFRNGYATVQSEDGWIIIDTQGNKIF